VYCKENLNKLKDLIPEENWRKLEEFEEENEYSDMDVSFYEINK